MNKKIHTEAVVDLFKGRGEFQKLFCLRVEGAVTCLGDLGEEVRKEGN